MEQVVFDEQAVADRIRLIAATYEDLVRVKERLEGIVNDASSQTDYYSAVSLCTVFTRQYADTAESVVRLFRDAKANLDMVVEVFRDTVETTYAANSSIAEDFAAIQNLQLDADVRVIADPWKATRVHGKDTPT